MAERFDLINVKDYADGEYLAVAQFHPAHGHFYFYMSERQTYDPERVKVVIADVKADGHYVDLKQGQVYTPISTPISEEVRDQPPECHYELKAQEQPAKAHQNYSQAGNLELGNVIMKIVAPHWDKRVRTVCADDIRHYLDRTLTRMWTDIVDFHHRYGLDYGGAPRLLPDDLDSFRVLFMAEELQEYAGVEGLVDWLRSSLAERGPSVDSLELRENRLDALVDLVYVALGTAYLSGFNFAEAWRRVHRANMSKVRVERACDSKRGSTFDVVKPAGWTPPSHKDLVGVMPKEPEAPAGTQHELF